jgi:hypothetical protein
LPSGSPSVSATSRLPRHRHGHRRNLFCGTICVSVRNTAGSSIGTVRGLPSRIAVC